MALLLNDSLPENIDDIDVAAFDIDGTLSRDDSQVSDETVAALRRLADSGIHVVLASGRMAPAIRKLFIRMDRTGYIIGCNGAITVHMDHDEIIGSHPISDDRYRKIVDFGRTMQLETTIFGADSFYTEVDGQARQLLKGPNEGMAPEVTNLDELAQSNRLKVMYYVALDRPASVVAELREEFPLTVKTLPTFYELTAGGVDKWSGLIPVLQDLGTTPRRTLGMGDSENDLTWLPNVGISVAMGNAYPAVKDACDYEIGPNQEDAAADFINRWADRRLSQQNKTRQ